MLRRLHDRYPMDYAGFKSPSSEWGKRARRLEQLGLVRVNVFSHRLILYALTDAGRAALEAATGDMYRDRLRAKYTVDGSTGCWVWNGAKGDLGYGVFRYQGRNQPVHRASYKMHKGEIPKGLVLDHLCRNPSCINPDHLEPVTQLENVNRGVSAQTKRAAAAAKTHCRNGHPYSENEIFVGAKNKRRCKQCQREKALAEYYANHEVNKAKGRVSKRKAWAAKRGTKELGRREGIEITAARPNDNLVPVEPTP